jgi:hypothetical protein
MAGRQRPTGHRSRIPGSDDDSSRWGHRHCRTRRRTDTAVIGD